MGWHYSEKKFRGDSGQNWPPLGRFFKCMGKSLHWKNVGVAKNGSKKSKFEKKKFLHNGHTKNLFCAEKSDSGFLQFSPALGQTENAQSYYRGGLGLIFGIGN